jgi:hypothetical protein
MSIATRLDKLESGSRSGAPIIIWQHHDETSEAAAERWKRENPGKDIDTTNHKVVFVSWLPPSDGLPQ